MLTEEMLEFGDARCPGSRHPAQTVIHGNYITRPLCMAHCMGCDIYQ
jgi:hypothetical protein